MSYVKGLKCRECHRSYPTQAIYVCEFCFGPLEVHYDYDAIKRQVSREKIAAGPQTLWRYKDLLPIQGDRLVDLQAGFTPLIVPGIVVAIGIYYAYSRYGLVGTPIAMVLAHTCLAVPFVVTSVTASLAGLDPRLEQASLSLGATPGATFWQVTLPLIRPGVLVGALFAFITSFDELIVALFISGTGAVTLPRRMWDDLRFQIDPTIAAVSTLTIVLTAALMGAAHYLRKRNQA